MNLGTCSFTSFTDRNNLKEIEGLECHNIQLDSNTTYTGTGFVYRAGFMGDDGAYYISQDLLFTIIIWFWSIFFVGFSLIALSIKSFKLGLKK